MQKIWEVYRITGNCGHAYIGIIKRELFDQYNLIAGAP